MREPVCGNQWPPIDAPEVCYSLTFEMSPIRKLL